MSTQMERPLFRSDLVCRPIDSDGSRFVEVTDPDSGQSYRFYEIEYAIACAMDGERDVAGLSEWAKIELGLEPSEDELRTVIGTLKELGYLDGVPASRPAVPAPTPPARVPAAGSVTRGWDAVSEPDLSPAAIAAATGKPATPAAPAKAGSVTRGWDAVSEPDLDPAALAAATGARPAAPAAPAKAGSVTRGWDAVSEPDLNPAAVAAATGGKAATPAAPAKGAVTRGWDVQDPDVGPAAIAALTGKAVAKEAPAAKAGKPASSGPISKPAAPAPASGGVTRGWDAVSDVELGFAGKSSLPLSRPEAPKSQGIELGHAGNVGLDDPDAISVSPTAAQGARPDLAPGVSQGGLSTDLSEHIAVRTDDVKEAVRQSKVIQAVAPPEDFNDATPAKAPSMPAAPPPMAAAASAPEPEPPAAKSPFVMKKTMFGVGPAPAAPAAKSPESRPQKQASPAQQAPQRVVAPQQPMVLPEKPAEISRPMAGGQAGPAAAPTATVPATRKKSALLPFLLIVLFLAAAGAAVYWWVELRESGDGQPTPPPAENKVTATPGEGTGTPAKPSEPPAITATLEAGPSDEQTINAPRAGVVGWLAPAGGEVAEGAPIAKFDGFANWERELTTSQDSAKEYQEKLDQATSKDDKVAMKSADTNFKRKQRDIERAQQELAKFVVAAPIGGVVQPVVEAKARVKKDDPVAKILAQSGPRASFTVPADRTQVAGDEVQVVSKADAGLKAKCKVESAEAGQVVVTCPTDSGLAPGTEVVLK